MHLIFLFCLHAVCLQNIYILTFFSSHQICWRPRGLAWTCRTLYQWTWVSCYIKFCQECSFHYYISLEGTVVFKGLVKRYESCAILNEQNKQMKNKSTLDYNIWIALSHLCFAKLFLSGKYSFQIHMALFGIRKDCIYWAKVIFSESKSWIFRV